MDLHLLPKDKYEHTGLHLLQMRIINGVRTQFSTRYLLTFKVYSQLSDESRRISQRSLSREETFSADSIRTDN
jgi:hypothetical protein